MNMSWYTGSVEGFNNILKTFNDSELKQEILLVPSHYRLSRYGKETLDRLNINYTERRSYEKLNRSINIYG